MAKPKIDPQLAGLVVPITQVKPLEGNPRRGDVEAIKASYARFGQRKPIVARKKGRSKVGEILAGNHQYQAAVALEWDEIAVLWVKDDDNDAKAFALADNRTHDLGYYDSDALAALMQDVDLEGTGYTEMDLDALIGQSIMPEVDIPTADPNGGQLNTSAIFQWGFLQWKQTRVRISAREVAALDALFENYMDEQGADAGFGWHLVDERVTDEAIRLFEEKSEKAADKQREKGRDF